MSDYLVSFTEEVPSIGPSEVAYAEVLANGWVCVLWRDKLESVVYYPQRVVLSVKTPSTDVPEAEATGDGRVAKSLKEFLSNYAKSAEPTGTEDEAVE